MIFRHPLFPSSHIGAIIVCFIQCLILMPGTILGQTKISGTVLDNKGLPLPGANVYIKDSYDGATTDTAGVFKFKTTETGAKVLVVSFVGFETIEEKVDLTGEDLTLNPRLKEAFSESNTVLITAGGFGANDKNKAIVLNPLDIVTTPGGNGDIYSALNYLPGTNNVGEENGLFVRGGAAAETATIIDEMIVQRPFFSSVPDIPSRSRFNPYLFKGTFFSTGGYSARYGQALSSALVLNSQDLADTTRTGINLTLAGGGGFHTKKWKKTSLSVSANYVNLVPLFAINRQRANFEQPPRGGSGSVIFRHKPNQGGIIKFFTSYSRSNMIVNDFFPIDSVGRMDTTRTALGTQNLYSNFSYRQLLNDNWAMFSGASFSLDTDKLKVNNDDIGREDLRAQARVWLSRSILKNSKIWFGAEAHSLKADQHFNAFALDAPDLYSAAFVEGEIYLSPKLVTRIGGRVEYSDLLGKVNAAPRVSFAYKTGKNSTVSLATGQFYQNPGNEFTYYTRDLNFERADHYLLNYTWTKSSRTFRAEAYYKNYGNLVRFFDDSLSFNGLAYDNSGNGFARGLDIFWRDQKSIRNGDYWISYSFLDTERLFRDYPVASRPYFASKHNFSVVYKHFLPSIRLALGASYNYSSGRTFRVPGDVLNAGSFQNETTPNFHLLAANVSYLTTIQDNFTVIFFSLNNVLNRNNVFGYRYSPDGTFRMPINPSQKRSIFLGIFISIQ